MFVAETTAEAIETARPYLVEKYDTYLSWGAEEGVGGDSVDAAFEELASDRSLVGSPEDVVKGIERYRETFDLDHLVMRSRWPGMPVETARDSLRLFAEEVVPRFE